MGRKKNRPKHKNYFLNKVFENITDNNTDLRAALKTYFQLL